MGRLTEHDLVGQNNAEPIVTACNNCDIWKQLCEYKDLEEQGRLIEQKYGEWIPNKQMVRTPTTENYHCSECTQTGKTTAYCPNCGAKMEVQNG